MRKKHIVTDLTAIKCCEVPPNDKLTFHYRPMEIDKTSGQFENSVFVSVGNLSLNFFSTQNLQNQISVA